MSDEEFEYFKNFVFGGFLRLDPSRLDEFFKILSDEYPDYIEN